MPIILPNVQKNYRTQSSRDRLLDMLDNEKKPHEIAWRFIEINKVIRSDSFVDQIKFYNDLIIQPFFTIIFWLGVFMFPDLLEWFGMDISFSYFNLFLWILSAIQTLTKLVTNASLVKEYYDLSSILFQWRVITRVNGGPYITGPAEYEPLIYADYVARIIYSLGG